MSTSESTRLAAERELEPSWRFSRGRTIFFTIGAIMVAGTIAGIVAVADAQYVPPEGTTDVFEGPRHDVNGRITIDVPGQSGIGLHITLADGQTFDLRARDVVISFPNGGALRVSESGVLPENSPSPPQPTTPTPV